MKLLVSVDCITYNHKDFIKDALDGFLMQKTNFPFEVLIHDDASTDGTQDILRQYEREYPKIFKIIYEKENQYSKLGGSLTKLVKKYQLPRYSGKYVAYCEGDDYWTDADKLQKQVDFLEAHPDYSCVFHSVALIHNGKFISETPKMPSYEEQDVPTGVIIANGGFMNDCSMVYRTNIAKNRPSYYYLSDVDDLPLKIHIAINGKVHYFPEVMSAYRLAYEGSWTSKVNGDIDFMIEHGKAIASYLVELNKATKGEYAAEISRQTQYYVNSILNSNKKAQFTKLIKLVNEISQRQNDVGHLRNEAEVKANEANAKQKELFIDFIEGTARALN